MKAFSGYMIAALVLAGCAKSVLSPGEYVDWVRNESNGLCVTKEIAGNVFQLQYKPAAFEVLLQNHGDIASVAELQAQEKQIDELQYFTLTITTSDQKELGIAEGADEDQYTERMNYMMSEMQYDFELVDGNDTLPCVFFHAERNFNLSPENHILLGFEKPEPAGVTDKTLMYNDRILDCGPVKITIKASDLEDIPELKLPE